MGIFDSIRDKLMGENQPNSPSSANEQPQEDIELCSFVRNYVEEVRGQANRIAQEGIWMTNISYLLGFDSVYYDPALRQFRPLGRGINSIRRNRIHSNQILPAVQNRTARMIKNPPKYEVRPNSVEEDDKDGAKLGQEVIGDVWDRQCINRKRIDLSMWLQECGHSYMKVSWDEELGDPIIDPISNEYKGCMGDIRIDVSSAFECFPDPLAKTFDDVKKFAQAKVRKLDYFRTHYPERGEMVKEEGAWLLSAQYEMRINTLNTVGPANSGTVEQMKNAAIEISYYEGRSKKHPNGRHVVVANGVLLKNAQLPFGEIPFTKFDDVVIGGKYNSESLITHARPIQDQYNRNLVKTADWVNRLAVGKYIAAKGHGLMQEGINDQSGEVVEYDPVPNAGPPQAMSIPVMPSYLFEDKKVLKQEIWEMFGLSEIAQGRLPSAGIPARGMEILLEQDETRIGLETEQHEHSFARLGMMILKCADKNYVMERKLKGKDANRNYSVRQFTGQELRKNFDVTVIRGSTTPNVKVIKRQEILNLYGQGLLGNPQDPSTMEKVLGMLEYGNVNEAWEDFRVDMQQIQRTIKEIEAEQIPEVNKLDNHALHILTKNRYRKSDKYLLLTPMSQDILKKDLDNHALAGATLMNPALAHPPDDGPPPDQMMQMLQEQARGMGIEDLSQPPQNIQMGEQNG